MTGWRPASLAVLFFSCGCASSWAADLLKICPSSMAAPIGPSQPLASDDRSMLAPTSHVPISDTDFVYFLPRDIFDAAPLPGDLRYVQAIVVSHRTPMTSLTIPISYSGTLTALVLDSTVITAPGVLGVSFGPGGHDSLWTTRLVQVDNINKALLLQFSADAPVGPWDFDTLCYLHWLVPGGRTVAVAWVILDTIEVSGEHLQLTSPSDTLTPTWSQGSIQVGEIGVQDSALESSAGFSIEVQPNPFNSQVRIHYGLQTHDRVSLAVFNTLGRRVRWWPLGSRSAGPHEWLWDARDEQGRAVGSGVYYFVLEQSGRTTARAGVLLK